MTRKTTHVSDAALPEGRSAPKRAARPRVRRPAKPHAPKAPDTLRPAPADPVTEEFIDALVERYGPALDELAKW